MTSKVQPAAGYWTLGREDLGTRFYFSEQKHLFRIFSACWARLQTFLKGKSDAYKKLICRNWARALSSPSRCFQLSTNLDKDFFRYLWYCGKKQIECGLAWSVLLSTTMCIITVVRVLYHNKFWPLWWSVSLAIRVKTTLNHIRFVFLPQYQW